MRRTKGFIIGMVSLGLSLPEYSYSAEGGAHSDPFAGILLFLALIVAGASVGRYLAIACKQPPVLGELLIGVLAGNIGVALNLPVAHLIMHMSTVSSIIEEVLHRGIPIIDAARHSAPALFIDNNPLLTALTSQENTGTLNIVYGLWVFSNLGVILLLFMVGLESSVAEMLSVGPRALGVALIGVVAPGLLGFLTSSYLLPTLPHATHLFIGAILCATSVGITARVLKDLGKLEIPEAKIVLGAAVIDDVLGLLILSIVVGIVTTGSITASQLFQIVGSSLIFLSVLLIFGERLVKVICRQFAHIERVHLSLVVPLMLVCFLGWISSSFGLAAIIGAFMAGLLIQEEYFSKDKEHGGVRALFEPLEVIFAPVFFVVMGMQVDLSTLSSLSTIGLALALSLSAIVGKVICGLAGGAKMDRLSIGIGMVPRGEVGLIFASIGKTLGVVSEGVFSAVILMVMLTTVLTPLGLSWSVARWEKR